MRRTTLETEESGSPSESSESRQVSAGLEGARVCLRGRLRSGKKVKETLGLRRAKQTTVWTVPWPGRGAALRDYCCRFSPPEK